MQHAPPLHVADGSKGTARPLQFGTSVVAGAARTELKSTTDCLRGSDSGLSLEVYSWSLFQDWMWSQGSGGL